MMAWLDLLRELLAASFSLLLFPWRIFRSIRNLSERRFEFQQLQHAAVPPQPAAVAVPSKPLRKVFISCGDMSGEIHALRLVEELRKQYPEVEISGFGGVRLSAAGVEIWQGLANLNVMGFADVARKLPLFFSCVLKFASEVRRQRPQVVVLIDYPGLNQRLLRICKRIGVPVVDYIAPQLWAWGGWRVEDFKQADALLTILPFEEDWYRRHGAKASYVGHPLGDGLKAALKVESQIPTEFADNLEQTWVGLLPGSRISEIKRNLPLMLEAAAVLQRRRPGIRFLLPHLRGEVWPLIDKLLAQTKLQVVKAPDCFHRAIPHLKAAMVTSGTASLEVAAHGVPNIVVYAITSTVKEWLTRRVVAVPWAGSLNLIASDQLAPEHLGGEIDPLEMASDIETLLDGKQRKLFLTRVKALSPHFSTPGCAARAAQAVIAVARFPEPEENAQGEHTITGE